MLLSRAGSFRHFARNAVLVRRVHAQSTAKEAYLEHLTGEYEGITVLKLDRPAARNALSVKLLGEFRQALADIRFAR